MTTSSRYGEALNWAEQLHQHQSRHGKAVPFLAHVISVSALVWEDGGNEDQAIAGLLHDSIEDAGQSQASIRERFGNSVATIVGDCTDPGKAPGAAAAAPWMQRKQRFIATLPQLPDASLLVTAADKAHNCRDRFLDAVVDPASWSRFPPGFDASAWYFWSLHKQLQPLLPASRSVKLLGDAVRDMLTCPQLLARLPRQQDPEQWVATYLERPETHSVGV
ncbi:MULTISPECIES: HD domain-containing protein [unclassified Cyanobium]|uniref:HD domain-containing protein n=1 Tax=unclassified Cyanobium TaxID=2627006 RepID=UPI0020CEEF52|nr:MULTISPECIES: HD domain-containing protein [unclassified Cyanobium]MCP9832793.1 HD domain-containing protein [Cyanobium sp. La Preciosa 7G6]MCP9935543.1 HD domain-containing protein [Cyanobium sp. Aljojuca 7A6]